MKFTATPLSGVYIVDADVFHDERGYFARAWIAREFADAGLSTRLAQGTQAFNKQRGTIRGLHFQAAPLAEVKVVRVIRGAVFDVAVDLRPDSSTFRRWFGIELSAENHRALYIPEGFAHGYQTLTDDAELFYLTSADYEPSLQRGVRWDDPAFGVQWPLGRPTLINERDASFPDF